MKIILTENQYGKLLSEINDNFYGHVDDQIREDVNDVMISINKMYPELKITIDKLQPLTMFLINNKSLYINSINKRINNSKQMASMFYNFLIKFITDVMSSNIGGVKRFIIRRSFKGRDDFKKFITRIIYENYSNIVDLSNYGRITWIDYMHTDYFKNVVDWKHEYETFWYYNKKDSIITIISELVTSKIYS